MSQVIGDTCGISLRGISKEIPWPGSRCGWMEVFNKDKNSEFNNYINTILSAKRLEVCSTTLPQMSIPDIFNNPKYKTHKEKRLETIGTQ